MTARYNMLCPCPSRSTHILLSPRLTHWHTRGNITTSGFTCIVFEFGTVLAHRASKWSATICPWGSGVGGRTNSMNRLGHRWLAGQSSAARGNYTGLYCAVMQTGHESYPIHVHTTSTKWRNIWNETVVTRIAQAWDVLMAVAVLRNVVFVHTIKSHRGSWGTAPLILNLGARRKWVVNFAPRPLYPWKEYRYPLYRRLGGSRSRSGRFREDNLSPPAGFKPRIVQPVASRYIDNRHLRNAIT